MFFPGPGSTVHCIYGFSPPQSPGQNPGQKPGQKPGHKPGGELFRPLRYDKKTQNFAQGLDFLRLLKNRLKKHKLNT